MTSFFTFVEPLAPLLRSASHNVLDVNFTKLEDVKWDYFYNGTAVSADNRTFTKACNQTTMICFIDGLASNTNYAVYMEACMIVENGASICSRFSEALDAWTTAQG